MADSEVIKEFSGDEDRANRIAGGHNELPLHPFDGGVTLIEQKMLIGARQDTRSINYAINGIVDSYALFDVSLGFNNFFDSLCNASPGDTFIKTAYTINQDIATLSKIDKWAIRFKFDLLYFSGKTDVGYLWIPYFNKNFNENVGYFHDFFNSEIIMGDSRKVLELLHFPGNPQVFYNITGGFDIFPMR